MAFKLRHPKHSSINDASACEFLLCQCMYELIDLSQAFFFPCVLFLDIA